MTAASLLQMLDQGGYKDIMIGEAGGSGVAIALITGGRLLMPGKDMMSQLRRNKPANIRLHIVRKIGFIRLWAFTI